jgi:hypothetical protein
VNRRRSIVFNPKRSPLQRGNLMESKMRVLLAVAAILAASISSGSACEGDVPNRLSGICKARRCSNSTPLA